MSEEDRVFARFRGARPTAGGRREVVNVPRRGTGGSRSVEVVHLRGTGGAKPREPSASRRAETWQDGFRARPAPALLEPAAPAPAEAPPPTVHVMPMWTPAPVAEEPPPTEQTVAPAPAVRATRARGRPAIHAAGRRVADPFDAADEGANCLRCGYLVEPAREQRGLLTCAACG